jgi:ATP-binding cassette subfamily B protein/subfamily B ATP-binding cassette protein MsbA
LANAYANISLGQRLVYDLASDLFARLQSLSLRFHTSKAVGDNIRRVTADCTCVSVIVKDALVPVLTAAVTLVAMFLVLWRINPVLALLSVVVVPLMALAFRRYAQPMLERSWEQQEIEGRMYDVVEQTFTALPVVQAFTREPLNDIRYCRATGESIAAAVALLDVQMKFKILIGLATALGTAVILWFGTQQALAGAMTVGTILLFLSYVSAFYAPVEAVMYTGSTLQGAAGSARRVLEVLQTEREVMDQPGAVALARAIGHVRLENITFGYEPERPVLRDVSLEARPGEMIALVGATGAGKTTLVSLLPRFFDPWTGRVCLDGRDLREVRLKSLRENIGLVLQDSFLFPLTLAENIAYGRPAATMAEIEAAARAARAHDFITRLPQGYRTTVGERGATLSGGERQRISIARALLLDAPILILDEPTSALDTETEAALLDAIERLKGSHTIFVIAHRLSTVRRADRIVVLTDGRIVETGNHDELLARGGRYAAFHRIQFSPEAKACPKAI